MHGFCCFRRDTLVGRRLRAVRKGRSVVQRELHPVREDVARDERVLSVVEAQRVDVDELVVRDEVVVGPCDRHALALHGGGDLVVSDVVIARAPVPIRGSLRVSLEVGWGGGGEVRRGTVIETLCTALAVLD